MLNSAVCMLDNTVSRFPERVAVWDEHGEITFSQFRQTALNIGTALLSQDRKLRPVIVLLPKSSNAIAAFFGALYSGRPYVPLGDNIPQQRLQYIVSTMQGADLITSAELMPRLDDIELGDITVRLYEDICDTEADERACMDKVASVIDTDIVYIMHTSGSTGRPKGVAVTHRGLVDFIDWLADTFGYDEHSVIGNQAPFYFDGSIKDIYTMAYTGAKLVLVPDIFNRLPTKLPMFVNEHGIDTLAMVPTVMISAANSGILETELMPGLKRVLFAGEVMPNRQLNIWRRVYPDVTFANMYGPTETTVDCICYIADREFADTDPLPIGVPRRNIRAMILRPDGTQAEDGEQGEICIQGAGIASGYWKKPEITRGVFTQNPLVGEYDDRIYHTGDIGYVAPDGNIMFLGRRDSQVQIHGNRVELGEIETVVKSIDSVENACVLYDTDAEEIVLFVQSSENIVLRKLNMELGRTLQKYMLPKKLYVMPQLPLNANGKIDRVALKRRLDTAEG